MSYIQVYTVTKGLCCAGGGYKGARGHPVVRTGAQRTLRPGSVPYPNGPMGYDKGRGGHTVRVYHVPGVKDAWPPSLFERSCFVISSTIAGISPLVKGSEDLPLPVVDPAETSVVVPWTVVVPIVFLLHFIPVY